MARTTRGAPTRSRPTPKAATPKAAKPGRKPLDLDPALIEFLAGCGCTHEEIAAHLHCSPDTLTRRFADALEKGKSSGRASLRRKQWQVAMDDGHKAQGTMLVWLGKQLLGQKDRHDHTTDEQPMETVIRVVREQAPSHA